MHWKMAMRVHLVCSTLYARCQSQSIFWHLLGSSNRPVHSATASARFATKVSFCSSRRYAAAMHVACLNATARTGCSKVCVQLCWSGLQGRQSLCHNAVPGRHWNWFPCCLQRHVPRFKQQKILGQSGYAELDTDNAPLPSWQHKKGQHATAHLQQIQHNSICP